MVIATGGGVVLNSENVEALKDWYTGMPGGQTEVILARINRKKGSRPLLKKNLGIEDIEKMLAEREEHYALADFRVDTSNKEMDKIVQEIIQIIRNSSNRRGIIINPVVRKDDRGA